MMAVLAVAVIIVVIGGIATATLAAVRLGDQRWARRVRRLADDPVYRR